jgi:aminocarboxymuconate-semialdehyde decarboxylase
MRRFFYDTITHDPQVLRSVIDVVGPEQVVLGSDYPFDMGDERPADTVRALGLDPAAEAAILAGNAERLLGLAATRTTQETRA